MGSLTGSNLAMHPRRFGDGPELPLGTYTVVELSDGVWTVERRIGAERWYPLRADRAWRTWRSWQSCKRDVYDDAAMAYTCGDWPHWGSLS